MIDRFFIKISLETIYVAKVKREYHKNFWPTRKISSYIKIQSTNCLVSDTISAPESAKVYRCEDEVNQARDIVPLSGEGTDETSLRESEDKFIICWICNLSQCESSSDNGPKLNERRDISYESRIWSEKRIDVQNETHPRLVARIAAFIAIALWREDRQLFR